MRRCSIFVTLLKNEYIEVEFNKARCFCSFRCLSNPHSCTITSLIFRTQGIRALLSVRKFLRVQVSVRIVPCATFLVRSLPCAYFRAQISSCASFRIPVERPFNWCAPRKKTNWNEDKSHLSFYANKDSSQVLQRRLISTSSNLLTKIRGSVCQLFIWK